MENFPKDIALFRALLEACVDAVIVSDSKGMILRTNPAAATLFGYGPDEMDGQSVNTLMPEAMAKLHQGFVSAHLETGETQIIGKGREVEGLRKDRSVFPMHISVGRAAVEGQIYFVAIVHDLTRQHATLRALERSQRLDAIGKMTGGIAHDFNNLLTVVIGNLELLDMRGGDEKHLSLVRDALDSAQLGAELIRQLMVFARQSPLRPIEADLGVLCQGTLTMLERTFGDSYEIKSSIAPGLHKVLIDPVQLQSALMNLALNARDAMPVKGQLLIAIENVTVDDTYMAQETTVAEGDYVRLSVSDNGKGMSAETQKRAFEPFYTTKFDSGGTGLGLAMVYGFVRQSGGHVSLYSEKSYGTTFSLYFPAIATDHTAQPAKKVETAGTEPPQGQGQLVLVVEDNPQVRNFAVARLQDLGYRTQEAENGDKAYAMLKSGLKADVLFSDLVMPGNLNGFDLAERVAAEFPSIKTLLTSGYASDVASAKGHFALNKSDILHKPYHQSDLAHRIHALLKLR